MNVLKIVTDSTQEPITRLEAKAWLRVEEQETAEDPLIDSLVTLARQRIETCTQRAFLNQTWDYYLDEAPDLSCGITLPKAPLVSITSIKGFSSTETNDSGGTAMSTADWYVDTAHEFGSVVPISGATFPTATREINPFIIRFVAGYSSGTSGVPEEAKTQIKQLVAELYEHRGDEPAIAHALESYPASVLDLPSWG